MAICEGSLTVPAEPLLWSWRCVGCGRCFSPLVSECPHCQPATRAYKTGTTYEFETQVEKIP